MMMFEGIATAESRKPPPIEAHKVAPWIYSTGVVFKALL